MLQLIEGRGYQEIFDMFRYSVLNTMLLDLIFQYELGIYTAEELLYSLLEVCSCGDNSYIFLGGTE